MSLMQLLAVGRSIRTIRDQPSPYKMKQSNLLPKFGTTPAQEVKAQVSWAPTQVKSEQPTFEKLRLIALWARFKRKATMKIAESEMLAESTATVASSPAAYPRGRWTFLQNPFSSKPISNRVPGPIQGELALETVKVVRNDLSDSDLEVVPTRKDPEPQTVPMLRTEPHDAQPAGWSRITTRLFGPGKP